MLVTSKASAIAGKISRSILVMTFWKSRALLFTDMRKKKGRQGTREKYTGKKIRRQQYSRFPLHRRKRSIWKNIWRPLGIPKGMTEHSFFRSFAKVQM